MVRLAKMPRVAAAAAAAATKNWPVLRFELAAVAAADGVRVIVGFVFADDLLMLEIISCSP